MRHRVAVLTALTLAPAALAQPRPSALSAVEHSLGVSPIHRVAGHGRLTVGIARDGDLAVLSWPSPSCCDQLTHLASNALDARSQPRIGVREGLGAALGLALRVGATDRVAWLHDPSAFRTVSAGYRDADSLQPVGVYEHIATGVRVELTDAVIPAMDTLQRHVRVRVPTTAGVSAVAVLAHTNLGPTSNVISRLPVGDVLADNRNDYVVVWNASVNAFIHFRPRTVDPVHDIAALLVPPTFADDHFGPAEALMRRTGDVTADVASLVERLDSAYGPGVYAYVGSDPAPSAFQAGLEDDSFCLELDRFIENVVALQTSGITLPLSPTVARFFQCPDVIRGDAVPVTRRWTRRPPSAWSDVQDGTLSNNPVAAWRSDTAMRIPVTLDTAGVGDARVLISFAETAAQARARYRAILTNPAADVENADRAAWAARAASITIPPLPMRISEPDRTRISAAARRALLHVFNGTDAVTGMIVASIARQAPYGLDWPRDGAFFDYALDVAGVHAAVTRRLAWALPLARTAPLQAGDLFGLTDPPPPLDPRTRTRQYPEAAWEMNYYNNGTMGGFFRFEIDNTAWMVWSACVHVAFVPEADRRALANSYWERVQRSTDLLAAWRDGRTGLTAPANEDDNAAFTATLHGGTSVFAALEAAARIARFTDHPNDAARWERRAAELRDALVRNFYDATRGRFLSDPTGAAASNPGSSSLGPTSWLVWPARLLPYSDPRVAAQVRYDLQQVLAALRGDPGTEGGAYLTKTTLAAAVFLANGGDPSVAPLLDEAVVRLARDVIEPDTQTMGEVFITIRAPDGTVQRRENRVSVPHLWEATLFELTVAAMSDPTRFNLDLAGLPPARTPAPGVVPFVPDPEEPDASVTADASLDVTRDVSLDARVVPPPPSDGCGCRAAHAPPASSVGLLAVAAIALLRARRRLNTAPRP